MRKIKGEDLEGSAMLIALVIAYLILAISLILIYPP